MTKLLTSAFFILLSFTTFSQSKKILIVSTNVDSVGNNASGTYLVEIALPFKHFTDKGYTVDIVTPSGGKAAIYSAKLTDELIQIQNSQLYIDKTNNTFSPDQINPKDYIAVYYPGGHGQYFDVMSDERIASITASIYERGGFIGSAGHGTASLVDVRLKNSKYLIEGKKMTSFPHWAELKWMNISNYGKLLPFDMQQVLERRGADLIINTPETIDDNKLTHVVDEKNRIVTGSFASSAKWVAEQVVILIQKS